jgi:TonB family protein
MSAHPPLPRPFGPYVLTRALGSDALSETYRAGTASGAGLKPFLLIREFSGPAVDRTALLLAMGAVVDLLDEVKGPTVAKGMVLGAVDDVPFAGIELVNGRTLDTLFAARASGVALPAEHALLIAERLLSGLEASRSLEKATGAPHGFLVPAFVMISNDGETRIWGGGLGSGLLPAIQSQRGRQALGPYIAPEAAESGKPSAAGDVFSVAAILLEALTGRVPPLGAAAEAIEGAVLSSDGTPVPEDIKKILARGLALDPARREKNVVSYRKQIETTLYSGPYAASTFNLAYFLQKHFEKTIQREEREIAAEEKIDPRKLSETAPRPDLSDSAAGRARESVAAPVRERPPERSSAIPRKPATPVRTLGEPARKKGGLSGAPLWGVVAAAIAILAGGGLFIARGGRAPRPTPVAAPTATPVPPTPVPTPTSVVVGKDDPLFVAEVQKKLLEEMKKREPRIKADEELAAKKRQAELDRTAEEARKAKGAEDAVRAARERADREEATRLATEAQDLRRREEAVRAARPAAPAPPTVKEGDLVDVSAVDTAPAAKTMVRPEATQLALQQHVSGAVLLRVLVDENGRPQTVELLRDTTPKVGLGEACQTAIRQWTWTPAVKDGKRVKTWIDVQIPFKGL